MGLFGNKKDDKNELPPLNFPELPKSVPSFEQEKSMKVSDAKEIKDAISNSDVPQMPSVSSEMTEKPLFVKIEKYKDLVNTLGKLKARLNDADHILQNLNDLKEKENRELAAWHSDLEKVRNQLLDIDRKLFE